MKPNCLFSRLDRLNYQNGYYRVQMGLIEDMLGSASLFLRRLDRLLGISFSYTGKSAALSWIRLTKRNFAPLTLYGKVISNQILDLKCCLSSVSLGWNTNSKFSSKYLACDRSNRQEPWQTYLTFSYLNV